MKEQEVIVVTERMESLTASENYLFKSRET